MSNIRKGDKVIVTTGRDKGKKGEVLKVFPKEDRALVAGVNMVKRHQRVLLNEKDRNAFLKPGDVVTLGIEGLGQQRQKIVRHA